MSRQKSVAELATATVGLMVVTLMVTIDMTIANVALPHMQGNLSASPEQVTWVLTSYMVGTAITVPLSGWLADRIGRKWLLMISSVGFVVMSMLCGAATSLAEMVAFRFLQGVAGASLIPMSQSAMIDLWPLRLRAQAIAVWAAVVTAAPVLGPTVGGYLTDAVSWRWVFYVNLPFGVLGAICLYAGMPKDKPRPGAISDPLGLSALIIFIAMLQLMLDRGPSRDWFDSREICVEAVVALCALYVFAVQTFTAKNPYLSRALLTDRNFLSGSMVLVLFMAIMMASTALLPTMMQQLLGYSALQSGLVTAPRGVGSVLGFMAAPMFASRFGARPTMLMGMVITVASYWIMSGFDLAMTDTPLRLSGFLGGVGQALLFNPTAVITFATLAPELRNEGAMVNSVFRSVGGAFGISMVQASTVRESAAAHEALVSRIVHTDPLISWALPDIFSGAGGLPALNAEVTRQGAMIAYDRIFFWMCVLSLAITPLILVMRPAKPGRGETIEVHGE